MEQARQYLVICFIGVPFITAYNVVSSIFRGLGDTKSPMIFVAIAGLINVGFDYILIGPLGMGAAGAAIATVGSQAFSVVITLLFLLRGKESLGVSRKDFVPNGDYMGQLLGIGVPVAFQEGLIQVSFLVITAIANSRGVDVAAAVGIVEKIISFLFLVPSSMLSTVSAVTAQNAGAGKHDRGRLALRYGISICVTVGLVVFVICQFASEGLVGLFVVNEPEVVRLGGQYLRSYSLDCAAAGIQFCFSGYFSAYGKSQYSFIHNIISIATVRIPGAWLASVMFPETLYPMGLAAPMGSLLSSVICVFLYKRLTREIEGNQGNLRKA
jgi:putative MATE family efflux protein